MNPAPSAPIPFSPARRREELRRRFLPGAVFAAGVVVAAWLWGRAVAPGSILAEAELVQSPVGPLAAGTLVELRVAPLQVVTAGEVLGTVRAAEPEQLAATLAVLRAELDALRAGPEPVLDARRVALEQERLRLDWMRERVALAAQRGQLVEAEAALRRLTQLRSQNVATEENFTTALNLRDQLAAQIEEQAKLVARLAPAAERSGPLAGGAPAPANSDGADVAAANFGATAAAETRALAAALRVLEEKLRLAETQLGPVPLRAPCDGVVTLVHHRAGETVAAGAPVVTVAPVRPARVIGFIRQTYAVPVRAGQRVELRMRDGARRSAWSEIVQVGAVVEPLPVSVQAAANRAGLVEYGLRVHIRVPAELELRPGEAVDVLLHDSRS